MSRFASTAARIASSSRSSARAGGGPPAFATRMSSPPKRSTVASTRRAGADGSVTSSGSARAGPGSSSAAVRSRAPSRAFTATLHPSAASARAAPRPSPFDAAVTSAVLPAIPRSMRRMLRGGTVALPASAPATRLGRHAARREETADHRGPDAPVDRVRRRAIGAGARRRDRLDELRTHGEPHAEDRQTSAGALRRVGARCERPRADRGRARGAGRAVGARGRRAARHRVRAAGRAWWQLPAHAVGVGRHRGADEHVLAEGDRGGDASADGSRRRLHRVAGLRRAGRLADLRLDGCRQGGLGGRDAVPRAGPRARTASGSTP